jgi:type IV pilus assembly protein PilB
MSFLDCFVGASDDAKLSVAGAYTALFRDAIVAAHAQKASDIHIEPTREGICIRFRVFGDMDMPWKILTLEHRQGFINEVKRLVNLSIAVSGKPQDSRVSYANLKLDLRVNLVPVLYGEKIVLRLLDLTRSFLLKDLQIADYAKEDLLAALRAKNGVLLISGPTGSGKTTTLYTVLSALERQKLNIVTIEDPIEYSILGINQTNVNSKVSFAGALRAMLRQDPDVMLVGEIRDEETADLCFKAASTGHLVLSTVHANGAPEVIQRLVNLGIEKYLIESCLRYSAAQRLVKRLCPFCSVIAAEPLLVALGLDRVENSQADFRENGGGCRQCKSGYMGRVLLFEYMGQQEVLNFMASDFSGTDISKVSLESLCLEKAKQGLIDVREVRDIA